MGCSVIIWYMYPTSNDKIQVANISISLNALKFLQLMYQNYLWRDSVIFTRLDKTIPLEEI
jgi:hypothetical protein